MERPIRRWLHHARPAWVDADDPIFITLCGQPRGLNQFANTISWAAQLESAEHLRATRRWAPLLLLAMPDHVHILARVAARPGVGVVMASFKRKVSYLHPVNWQKGGFDHRIRSDDHFREKWAYVLANPVRAGLVADLADWPFIKTWPRWGRHGVASAVLR
jgi:putative transposase